MHHSTDNTGLSVTQVQYYNNRYALCTVQVVKMCREHFDFVLPSLQLDHRQRIFVGSPVTTDLIKFVFA